MTRMKIGRNQHVRIIGLHGANGAGKDTVADYLVEAYGFRKLPMPVGIYQVAAGALHLTAGQLLRLKDNNASVKIGDIAPDFGQEALFYNLPSIADEDRNIHVRDLLRLVGDNGRRLHPEFWVTKFDQTLTAMLAKGPNKFVVPSVRMTATGDNERDYLDTLREAGAHVEVWHVWRSENPPADGPHITDSVLPFRTGERLLINGSDVDTLRTGVSLMVQGNVIVNTTKRT